MFAVGIAITGCDGGLRVPQDPNPAGQKTAEPKGARAARLLSLTGSNVDAVNTDYAGLVTCSGSLAVLIRQLQDSPLISGTQLSMLRQADDTFRARARTTGLSVGKTQQEVDSEIGQATSTGGEDIAASSKTAVNCIRLLANVSSATVD